MNPEACNRMSSRRWLLFRCLRVRRHSANGPWSDTGASCSPGVGIPAGIAKLIVQALLG